MLPFYRAWLSIRRARGADHRRGQRPRDRGRAVPGPGLRPAVRRVRARGWARRSSGSACTRAWRRPGCCPTWSAPPHARDLLLTGRTRGRRRGAAARPGLPGASSPNASSTRCWRAAGRSPATAPIASRLTTLALRRRRPRRRRGGLQWEALAQPVTLATEDLQEGIRAAREKSVPAVHRALSHRLPRAPDLARRGPRYWTSLAFPLRTSRRSAWGLVCGTTLGGGRGEGQRRPVVRQPVDKPVDNACGRLLDSRWRPAVGPGDAAVERPARALVRRR